MAAPEMADCSPSGWLFQGARGKYYRHW